jgi:beta-glucanase (GH16 family)
VVDPLTNHNLSYMGGMLTTWNKVRVLLALVSRHCFSPSQFCFTGGLIVTNVMLPGITNIFGLWPAVWTCVLDTCTERKKELMCRPTGCAFGRP